MHPKLLRRVKTSVGVGFFYCPYIPQAFHAQMRVNRDADPPLDPDDWGIAHGENFPLDLEWDPTDNIYNDDSPKTLEERLVDAYNRAKRAIERM